MHRLPSLHSFRAFFSWPHCSSLSCILRGACSLGLGFSFYFSLLPSWLQSVCLLACSVPSPCCLMRASFFLHSLVCLGRGLFPSIWLVVLAVVVVVGCYVCCACGLGIGFATSVWIEVHWESYHRASKIVNIPGPTIESFQFMEIQ